MAERSA
jgi:hypothetical protein